VFKDLKALLVVVHKALRVHKELRALREHKVHKELRVSRGLKDTQVAPELRELRGIRDRLEQVLQEILEEQDLLDPLDSKVLMVSRVFPVNKALLV
jgi:hypothetical protein